MLRREIKTRLIILLVGCFVLLVYCMAEVGRPERPPLRVLRGSGQTIGKRQGKTAEPKYVVDTLRLDDGRGQLTLKRTFRQALSSTAPSAGGDILSVNVQRIVDKVDTAVSIKSYATYFSRLKDTIYVVSSDTLDASKVSVTLLVR